MRTLALHAAVNNIRVCLYSMYVCCPLRLCVVAIILLLLGCDVVWVNVTKPCLIPYGLSQYSQTCKSIFSTRLACQTWVAFAYQWVPGLLQDYYYYYYYY